MKIFSKLSDEKLIALICGSKTERDEAFKYIFLHWRPMAMRILKNDKSPSSDIEDAVQEAIIVLDEKVRNRDFNRQMSLKNYFIGICKGRAYVRKRSEWRITDEHDFAGYLLTDEDTPEKEALLNEQKELIRNAISELGDECRQVLIEYMLSYSMAEIRELHDFSSESNTRRKAFNCRKKLKELINNNPELLNYFKNKD